VDRATREGRHDIAARHLDGDVHDVLPFRHRLARRGPAKRRENGPPHPAGEDFRPRFPRGQDEGVETAFRDDREFLAPAKGLNNAYTLL
jgi:hypothetical protein